MLAVSLVVGGLLLCAVTHMAVIASGGYGTPQSYVAMAVAAGIGCGSVFCGMAWSAKRYWLSILLVFSIFAGEAFTLIPRRHVVCEGGEFAGCC